jgi:hypothetical protein
MSTISTFKTTDTSELKISAVDPGVLDRWADILVSQ